MNPLRFLLAVVRAIQAIVNNLFGSEESEGVTADSVAEAAARWRHRQHQAYRRSQRERRKGCRHGRQTRCSARSRRRRTERPRVRRPAVPKRMVVEVRRIAGSTGWEAVRSGSKSQLLTAPSALAAEQRAAELLESRGGGVVLSIDSTGKPVFGLQVIPGWRWPLGAAYLRNPGSLWISERVLRNGQVAPGGAAKRRPASPQSGKLAAGLELDLSLSVKSEDEMRAAVLVAADSAGRPRSRPRRPVTAPAPPGPSQMYELRQRGDQGEWVLVRKGSTSQLLAADGKQRAIGRATALLRGTGGGVIRVLNAAGGVESAISVRPAGPPLGGFTVSETPVKEPA